MLHFWVSETYIGPVRAGGGLLQDFQNLHFNYIQNVSYIFEVPPSKAVGMASVRASVRTHGRAGERASERTGERANARANARASVRANGQKDVGCAGKRSGAHVA